MCSGRVFWVGERRDGRQWTGGYPETPEVEEDTRVTEANYYFMAWTGTEALGAAGQLEGCLGAVANFSKVDSRDVGLCAFVPPTFGTAHWRTFSFVPHL